MTYSLQKYSGRNTRHKCPKCGREHCFALYVDENNNPLDKSVGRCDHQESCGYHYKPKQFFADNTDKFKKDDWHSFRPIIQRPTAPKPLCTIPFEYVQRSCSPRNTFIEFLCSIIDRFQLESPNIERVMQDYCIGSTKDGRAIFWQIDAHKRVRTGKIIAYNANTGHRNKSVPPDWVHSRLKRDNKLPKDWELTQCLFGEHLLTIYPDKTVALVEAEKTAIICSALYPKYLWLSVGSVQNFSAAQGSKGLEMIRVLKGHKVVVYPDADGYDKWQEAAKNLKFFKCVVSDIIEKNATPEDLENKIDIADWLIRQLQKTPYKTVADELTNAEQILNMMIRENPALQDLIEAFDLSIV